MEFSTYFIEFGAMHAPLLIVLMAIKFVIVAGFFMHLKFDTRLFTRLMFGGLAGAACCTRSPTWHWPRTAGRTGL
jgi:hypothetical protein